MINWCLLAPQVEALGLYTALRQAEIGLISWSGTLAREHNRRWCLENMPDRLALVPGFTEEGKCECGGVCLILAADETGLYHRCTACWTVYRVIWSTYEGETHSDEDH